MGTKEAIKLFEEKRVRTAWDDEQEKWYFSIVDVVDVLTDSKDALTARKYWNKLKQRLKEEGNETVTNCHQLKLRAADGKMRLTVPHIILFGPDGTILKRGMRGEAISQVVRECLEVE